MKQTHGYLLLRRLALLLPLIAWVLPAEEASFTIWFQALTRRIASRNYQK
jgi:hypothetical protein